MRRASLLVVVLAALPQDALSHSGIFPGEESSGLSAMLREVFGGSGVRNFVHNFLKPIPDGMIGAAMSPVTKLSNGMMEQTFISPPHVLENGMIGNKWLPIDWPQGHVAVKSFIAEVVKAGPDGKVPPPTPCCGGSHVATQEEVFMHHWTVNKWQLPASMFKAIVAEGGLEYALNFHKEGLTAFLAGAGLNEGANGPCWDANLHLYFGIGNEVRGKTKEGRDPYEFPDPYGVEFDSAKMKRRGEFMVLNLHLIDTRNVTDPRACEECKCSYLGAKPYDDRTEGGLNCCHSTRFDGGKCPLVKGVERTNATYYVKYTIKWREFDATQKALEVIAFDATDNNTKWADFSPVPGGFPVTHSSLVNDPASMAIVHDARSGDFTLESTCHIEYYVPSCTAGSSCVHRLTNSWELPWPMEIVFLRNHYHTGGINMTTRVADYSCTGEGSYTKEGALYDVSTCMTGANQSFTAKRGDQLVVESFYKQDELPHYGVMAMSFVYAHIPKVQGVYV